MAPALLLQSVPAGAMRWCSLENILWCRYVTEKDLDFFKERVEQPGELKGAGPWEHMMYKDFGSFTYEAWRRSLAVRLLPINMSWHRLRCRWCCWLSAQCCACIVQYVPRSQCAG